MQTDVHTTFLLKSVKRIKSTSLLDLFELRTLVTTSKAKKTLTLSNRFHQGPVLLIGAEDCNIVIIIIVITVLSCQGKMPYLVHFTFRVLYHFWAFVRRPPKKDDRTKDGKGYKPKPWHAEKEENVISYVFDNGNSVYINVI